MGIFTKVAGNKECWTNQTSVPHSERLSELKL